MTLYDFLILPIDSKYEVVWDEGIHIETYTGYDKIYQLYALNDFFVEIIYDPKTNKIVDHLAFKQGEHLEKYLPEL